MTELRTHLQDRQTLCVDVPSKLQRIVPIFLKNRQDDIHALTSALNRKDFATIQSIGHKMKGSGAGYGLPYLTEIGGHIEKCAPEKNAELIQYWIAALSDYLQNVEIHFS